MPALKKRSSRLVQPGSTTRAAPGGARTVAASTLRRVLVAVDGSRASNAALRFARRMAQHGLWAPEAMTATEPVPTYVGDIMLPPIPVDVQEITSSVLLGLRSQVRRHGLPSWPAEVLAGPTVATIVDGARQKNAEVIVMGLGRHGRLARAFGAETVARVARHADRTVLAVHPSTRWLPRVAVVGVDFGRSSERAVREVIGLLDAPAELHLVHVMGSTVITSFSDSAWRQAYEDAVNASFTRLLDRTTMLPTVAVHTERRKGRPAEQLLDYARAVKADLVAVGSHDRPLIDRMLLGATSSALLREASCSVLVAAPSAREE